MDSTHQKFERRLRRSVAGGVVVLALLTGIVAGSIAELAGAGLAESWVAAGIGALAGGVARIFVVRRTHDAE